MYKAGNIFISLFLLFIICHRSTAQDEFPRKSENGLNQLLPAKSILLVNDDENSINLRFSLSLDNQKWKEFLIRKNSNEVYELGSTSSIFIRICTPPDKCVIYKLDELKRYKIYYNYPESRWDLVWLRN